MQALSNDFIITNQFISENNIRILSNRHTGIGFDQLLVVENLIWSSELFERLEKIATYKSEIFQVDNKTSNFEKCVTKSDEHNKHSSHAFKVHVFNADGSAAKFCGNGFRCIAYLACSKNVLIQTSLDFVKAQVHPDNTVSLYYPMFKLCEQRVFSFGVGVLVDIGNKHLVFQGFEDFDHLVAQALSEFGQDINIFNVRQIVDNNVYTQIYERGVGKTSACGSGAAAIMWSLLQTNQLQCNEATIHMSGGCLKMKKDDIGLIQTSKVNYVFKGHL